MGVRPRAGSAESAHQLRAEVRDTKVYSALPESAGPPRSCPSPDHGSPGQPLRLDRASRVQGQPDIVRSATAAAFRRVGAGINAGPGEFTRYG